MPSKPPEAVTGGRESLLVVDDETVQLRTASRILKHSGYHVTTASSVEASVRLFDEDETSEMFDLVIVDMLMPGLDGLETVAQLRQRRPGLKAVIAGGYAPEQTSAEAAGRGMARLAKPYTVQVLAAAVREALGRS